MYGKTRLTEALVQNRVITQEQLEQALNLQRFRREPLGRILVEQGFVSEERLLQVSAMLKGVGCWDLECQPPEPDAVSLLPASMCRNHRILPLQVQGERLLLGMRDPSDLAVIDMVRDLTRMRIEPLLVAEDRLARAIDEIYGERTAVDGDSVDRLVVQAMGELSPESGDEPADPGISEAEMRPVVGLVNQILIEAIRQGATDVHIEPRRGRVDVRYRLDGQLRKVRELPGALLRTIVARIKILAVLDIVEYRVPQDGRITVKVDNRTVDIRVSVLPNYHGQRIVLRILDKSIALRQLDELGLSDHNLGLFREMIRKPYGLILVTGPTGSGKTTTLYAAINHVKDIANNIMTCEDPVEYDIDGINQSQVNEKVGLTFAAQLRAILRQDPDVILVGEIRDKETADTAIRAALTGHLVLSTLHCNDAPSAVPRLMDMGVQPFLLSTALIGVMGQRLVRLLCPQCRVQYTPSIDEQALIEQVTGERAYALWRPGGCAHCDQTGYRGRSAVHEILPVTPEIQRLIASCEPVETVRTAALRNHYRPMQADALDRVLAGQTALAEVQRQVFYETIAPSTDLRLLAEAA